MKISTASLLIAFAGFLQESKCMQSGDHCAGHETGRIELTLENEHTLVGELLSARGPQPPWLHTRPRQNFQTYEVYFHATLGCTYQANLAHRLEESGASAPKSVKITIGKFLHYYSDEGFEEHTPGTEIEFSFGLDYVYITRPETTTIYFEFLTTDAQLDTMRELEHIREMREKRAGNPAGQTSRNRAWGHK